MPKEQINYPESYRLATGLPVLTDDTTEIAGVPEESLPIRTEPAAFVGWQGGEVGHVQLAMEMDIAHVAELLDQADENATRVTMWTGIIPRESVNKAIRVLRRARDQAYGRDE